jgi:hypothetical protein
LFPLVVLAVVLVRSDFSRADASTNNGESNDKGEIRGSFASLEDDDLKLTTASTTATATTTTKQQQRRLVL